MTFFILFRLLNIQIILEQQKCGLRKQLIGYIYLSSYWLVLRGSHLVFDLKFHISLHEKCPYSGLFWSVFSRIQTEYEEMPLSIQSECEKIRTKITQNTDTFHAVDIRDVIPKIKNILYDMIAGKP